MWSSQIFSAVCVARRSARPSRSASIHSFATRWSSQNTRLAMIFVRQHSGIGVLDKAVGVLHAVAESPCGLAELCDRTDLPRATRRRLAAFGGASPAGARPGWPLAWSGHHRTRDPCRRSTAGGVRSGTASAARRHRQRGISPRGTSLGLRGHVEPAAGLRDTVPVGARLPMTTGSGAKCCWPTDAATQKGPYCQRRSARALTG